jgi:cephalosporin hydroxylase
VKVKKQSVEEIERFVLAAGSDSIAVFKGAFEGGVHIQQVPDEIAPCIKAMVDSGETMKSLLEIGSAAGGTTFLLNHFFGLENIVLIDDNRHPKHTLRPQILEGIERKEIIGNSRDQAVIDQIEGQFDVLIIDGDHSYEGVTADIGNYLPFLRDRGFLVLHDTATWIWGSEVPRASLELQQDKLVEFVDEFVSKTPPVCGVALFRKVAP